MDHRCRVNDIECYQIGLADLTLRIPDYYDSENACCEYETELRLSINYCPFCGFKGQKNIEYENK